MTTRPTPTSNELTRDFWTGGSVGELRIQRCRTCARWQHPPKPMCTRCHGIDLGPQASSGTGTVWSYTTSQLGGSTEHSNIVADIELDDQNGLHLLSAIVEADHVEIGMPVVVAFEQAEDTWIPVFRLATRHE
jgi:uncharacterized protein